MCKGGHLLASQYLHREQVRMLMKAAVGQDSSSDSLLLSPPLPLSLPPPSPLSPCQMGVLTSQPLLQGHKEPMWSQLLQLLSLNPPPQPTHSFLIPFFLTCSSFNFFISTQHCLFFCSSLLAVSASTHTMLFTALFSPLSPAWTFYSSQQFAFYSFPLMSHRTAENFPVDLVRWDHIGGFLTVSCAPQKAQTVAIGRRL